MSQGQGICYVIYVVCYISFYQSNNMFKIIFYMVIIIVFDIGVFKVFQMVGIVVQEVFELQFQYFVKDKKVKN